VLALVSRSPRAIRTIRALGSEVLTGGERMHEPRDLRLRIAAGIVGLATGPFAVLEDDHANNARARLDLAARWIASAARGT